MPYSTRKPWAHQRIVVNQLTASRLSRFLRRSLPQLVVLSNLELSDNRHIRMTATIGGK
ncbi:flagellar biosynthesis FlhA domain protein [Shigella flexneri]